MPSILESPPPPSDAGAPGTPGPPSIGGLAGEPAQAPGANQGLQIITQHLATAEDAIRQAIKLKPELSVVLENWLNQVKPQIGQILFGGGQGGAAQGGGITPPTMGGGMMATGMAPSLNMRP